MPSHYCSNYSTDNSTYNNTNIGDNSDTTDGTINRTINDSNNKNIPTTLMQLLDIITPERIATQVHATSKKRVLETISEIFSTHSSDTLDAHQLFESLTARERLGTTAIDHGVAIPHGRIKDTTETIGAFVQLADGIDYDAMDQQPVNLLFALLVPEESTEEHLQLLARLAKMFSDAELREQLRTAPDNQALYNMLIHWDQTH